MIIRIILSILFEALMYLSVSKTNYTRSKYLLSVWQKTIETCMVIFCEKGEIEHCRF